MIPAERDEQSGFVAEPFSGFAVLGQSTFAITELEIDVSELAHQMEIVPVEVAETSVEDQGFGPLLGTFLDLGEEP